MNTERLPPILTTARTALHEITLQDIPYLLQLFKDSGLQGAIADDALEAAILTMLADYKTIGYAEYIVIHAASQKPMGLAGYRAIAKIRDQANTAVIIDSQYQRQSYGSEVLEVLIRNAKSRFGIRMLHAFIEQGNLASIQFFTRHGFIASGEQSVLLPTPHRHYQRACI